MSGPPGGRTDPHSEDTLDIALPADLTGPPAEYHLEDAADPPGGSGITPDSARRRAAELLDSVADWGPVHTAAGVFQLVPVRLERDLSIIASWMNDPAVAAFWELSGPGERTARHLSAQLDGDGRSLPCLGILDGWPMSYWEIYRADLDRLARYYPCRPHDTGLHLLIGSADDRGRGLGSVLLRAVGDVILDHRPRCARVVAEPDVRNAASLAAFRSAGFRRAGDAYLPEKRAAVMILER